MRIDAVITPSVRHCPPGAYLDIARKAGAVSLVIENMTIAAARNEGLRVAREKGWEMILFIDDDIWLGDTDLEALADRVITSQAAAGVFAVTDFPDNSVVMHAARAAGLPAPLRPNGGTMVLHVPAVAGREFPETYNEDMFFLHKLDVIRAGNAFQEPYDPFVPGRAAREEAGDLIAEAMHAGAGVGSDEEYWAGAIAARHELIGTILAAGVPERAAASLREAGSALSDITAAGARELAGRWLQESGTREAVR